jgi:exonuclease III
MGWLSAVSTSPTAIQPGPKFDYKLRWLNRLISYGQELLKKGVLTVLCGDFNVVPTPASRRAAVASTRSLPGPTAREL